MHVDHVWPYKHGGPTEWWNLVAACPDCNLSRQHRHYDERLIYENLSQVDLLGNLLGLA
jgi:5-methylcytosine-specific restriction endonuclease McrA